LPDDASPPVRDTLKPNLMGSCACAQAAEQSAIQNAATDNKFCQQAQRNSDRVLFI
jgi:hypothetical protein